MEFSTFNWVIFTIIISDLMQLTLAHGARLVILEAIPYN